MPGWYVYDDGQQYGPFDNSELTEHLRGKTLSAVFLWREGMTEWKSASTFDEITGLLKPLAPLSPIRSELAAPRNRTYKRNWSRNALVIGLIIGIVRFFTASRRALGFDVEGVSYFIGYVTSYVILAILIGFLSGLIADLFFAEREQSKTFFDSGREEKKYISRNFIIRHWRGDYSLGVAYWVIGFFGNIFLALVPILIAKMFKVDQGYNPYSVFATLMATWVILIPVVCWQIVGIWRSAAKYTAARLSQSKGAAAAALAQIAIILGALVFIGNFISEGLPQITATYRIAFSGDPDLPTYSIRVMRDGTEAEIEGGFKFGLTSDFEKILAASNRIKVVHLDSIGGRLGEGKKLFELIRSRKLSTYVSSKCLSACTLAFAGGINRYLKKDAVLGFHRGAFPGVRESDFDQTQWDVFRKAGFKESFVIKALSTPHKDMWQPTANILIEANVITAVIDGTKFAVSGLGTGLSKETLSIKLAKTNGLYKAISEKFPVQYDSFVDSFYTSLTKGNTEAETIGQVRVKLIAFVRTLLPLSDDDVLANYSDLLADQYQELYRKDPTSCYGYASGEESAINYSDYLSKATLDRELQLEEKAVRTAKKRSPLDKDLVGVIWQKLIQRLIAAGATSNDIAMMQEKNLPTSKHAHYCRVGIMLFREIARLHQTESAVLMRDIFASK